MKNLNTLLTICLLGWFTTSIGQTTAEKSTNKTFDQKQTKETSKPMNLVDEQVKILGGLFSELDSGNESNPFNGSTNYLEVIEKMDAPKETKEYLKEQYKLYALSIDSTKKDSLNIMVDKMMQKAMEKAQKNPN